MPQDKTIRCLGLEPTAESLVWDQPHPALYDVDLHGREPLPEAFHRLIEFGILASRRDPFDPACTIVFEAEPAEADVM